MVMQRRPLPPYYPTQEACPHVHPPAPPDVPPALPSTCSWMHMSITLGSIAAALLAFAAESSKSKSPMHAVRATPRAHPALRLA
jgi:hypothetical protein